MRKNKMLWIGLVVVGVIVLCWDKIFKKAQSAVIVSGTSDLSGFAVSTAGAIVPAPPVYREAFTAPILNQLNTAAMLPAAGSSNVRPTLSTIRRI